MNFIGIDVGKQELVVYDGKRERTFPNTPELSELEAFLQNYREEVTLAFEPTSTYSRFLENFCSRKGIPSLRPNPRILPHIREVKEKRSKNDQSDSQLLFLYGKEKGKGKLLKEDPLSSNIMAYLSFYLLIQKARVSFHNLREALSYDPLVPEEVKESLKQMEQFLKGKEEEQIDLAEEVILSREETREPFELLCTIKGVGRILALVLLALFRKYPDASRKEITALVGLDTVERESGKTVRGKPRISKRGNSLVRALLYEGTLSAVRHNPQVKEIYQRLREKGKPEKVARSAASHKLLLIAHAIYRKRVPYDPNWSKRS